MTQEELKEKIQLIQDEYDRKKSHLLKEYADANNPYKVGDIIEDHYHRIEITKIKYALYNFQGLPECIYEGIELKKDNTPTKRQQNTEMYQSNIKK